MAVELNIDGSNYFQTQEYAIEGVTFYISTRYNKRCGWLMDIYDEDNDPTTVSSPTALLSGLRVMPNGLLTWRYSRDTGLFEGDIYIADTLGTFSEDITKDNFGQGLRYVPVYFTKSELEENNFEDFTSYSS